ncbi:MAG: PD-(D/E)XK nuclease family protein [Promethearchaeota archaeon]
MTIKPEVLIENWEEKFENNKNGKFNPIIVTNRKIREEKLHSNILAWLFNPNNFDNENFLKSFLKIIKDNNKKKKFPDIEIENLNYKNVKIYREKNHIDLRINFPDDKFIIVIENKIRASQGETQLEDYSNIFEGDEYKSFEKLFIFHTLKKEKANEDTWLLSNYDQLLKILENRNKKQTKEICHFLDSYVEILKKLKTNEQEKFVKENRNNLEKIYSGLTRIEFSSENIDNSFLANCILLFKRKKEILEDIFQASLKYTDISKVISKKISENIKIDLTQFDKLRHLSIDKEKNYKIKIYSKGLLGIEKLADEKENESIYYTLWINVEGSSKIQFKMYFNFKNKDDEKIQQALATLHKKTLTKEAKVIFNNTPTEINEGSKAVNIYSIDIIDIITLETLRENGLEHIKNLILNVMLEVIPKIEKILRT